MLNVDKSTAHNTQHELLRCLITLGYMNIYTVTAVVGEGRAKVVSAVPVGVPRETVVGAVEGKT